MRKFVLLLHHFPGKTFPFQNELQYPQIVRRFPVTVAMAQDRT